MFGYSLGKIWVVMLSVVVGTSMLVHAQSLMEVQSMLSGVYIVNYLVIAAVICILAGVTILKNRFISAALFLVSISLTYNTEVLFSSAMIWLLVLVIIYLSL